MRVGVMRGGSCAVLRASGRRPGAEHRPGAQRPGWFGVRNPMETPTMPVLRPTLILPTRLGGDSVARGGGMPAGGWGFCSIRSLLPACRGSNAAIPPTWRPEWRILAARWPAVGIRRPALRVQRPRCSPPQRKQSRRTVIGEVVCDVRNLWGLTSAMGVGAMCSAIVDRRDASGNDRSNVACNSID